MSMKLYVGNLAYQTTGEDLQQLFAQAGTVESAAVIEDRETGRSRGFGFIEMSSTEEGHAAIQQFNGHEVGGRALNVNEAKPREDRGGRNRRQWRRRLRRRFPLLIPAGYFRRLFYNKASGTSIRPGAFPFDLMADRYPRSPPVVNVVYRTDKRD